MIFVDFTFPYAENTRHNSASVVSELKNSQTKNENFFQFAQMEEVNRRETGQQNWDNLLPYSANWTVMMKFAKGPPVKRHKFEDFFVNGNENGMMQLEKWNFL